LRYADHDLKDIEKISNIVQQVYMERKRVNVTGIPILEPKKWITGLYNT